MSYAATSRARSTCRCTSGMARARGIGDATPVTAGGLQSITGGNLTIDRDHVIELQKQANRFLDAKAPANFQALGAPLPLTGVLDDATALRVVQIMLGYASVTPGADVSLLSIPASQYTAWVLAHMTTAYATMKAYGDVLGLPAASPTIPVAVVVGAAVVALLLLTMGKKRRK